MSLLMKNGSPNLSGDKGTVTADWYTGVCTSGETGSEVITLGNDSTYHKVQGLWLNIENLTNEAVVTVRLYHSINGIETRVYQQSFIRGTDPNGLWIVNGALVINGTLRCELQSNNPGDVSSSIAWEWAME